MNIERLITFFGFENYDYYYHMTSKGFGDLICEEGLLVMELIFYRLLILKIQQQ